MIYLAWQGARLTWFFLAPDDLLAPSVAVQASVGRKISDNEVFQLDKTDLFGKFELVKAAAQPVQAEAPKTQLKLVLEGVFTATGNGKAGAIISERGRDAQYYQVGQPIPGNANLHAVYADHVLIERKGRLEKLLFDEDNGKGSEIKAVSRPSPAVSQNQNISTPEQFVAQANARLSENPVGALASVGLQPVSTGTAAGYVFNGNNPMLAGLNLKKGDVIRSVNGYALGDIEQDQDMLKEMSQQSSLEVEVERDGTSFYINYPLRR